MAKNFVQEGTIIRATAPYDRLSGQGAKIGRLFGVALTDILSTKIGDWQIEGVFDITKATGAWTEGAAVYWDDSAKAATLTAAGNIRIGVAVLNDADAMAASGDATGRVRLDEAISTASLRGVADGYAVARGQITTGSAADTVVTGLATVVAVVAQLDSDPGVGDMSVSSTIGDQAGSPAAGSIIIKTWKTTAVNDDTPIAATSFSKKVNWIAIGTL